MSKSRNVDFNEDDYVLYTELTKLGEYLLEGILLFSLDSWINVQL